MLKTSILIWQRNLSIKYRLYGTTKRLSTTGSYYELSKQVLKSKTYQYCNLLGGKGPMTSDATTSHGPSTLRFPIKPAGACCGTLSN